MASLDSVLRDEQVFTASPRAARERPMPTARPTVCAPQLLPCTMLHEGRHLAWLDPSARQSEPVRAAASAAPAPAHNQRPRLDVAACPAAQLENATELQLPLWLVQPLVKRRHVDPQLPKFYGAAYRNALRADAAHLNLSSHSDFYFDVGVSLATLCAPTATGCCDRHWPGGRSRVRGVPRICAPHAPHVRTPAGLSRDGLGAPPHRRIDDSSELTSMLLEGFSDRFHGLLDASLNITSKSDSTAIKEKLTLREKQRKRSSSRASHRRDAHRALSRRISRARPSTRRCPSRPFLGRCARLHAACPHEPSFDALSGLWRAWQSSTRGATRPPSTIRGRPPRRAAASSRPPS
jgi:hypothetical protein